MKEIEIWWLFGTYLSPDLNIHVFIVFLCLVKYTKGSDTNYINSDRVPHQCLQLLYKNDDILKVVTKP